MCLCALSFLVIASSVLFTMHYRFKSFNERGMSIVNLPTFTFFLLNHYIFRLFAYIYLLFHILFINFCEIIFLFFKLSEHIIKKFEVSIVIDIHLFIVR